jgi:diaminohydroxyphosphoribosylaminopyrimidine deaminase / 5-amino-6-(5-phosphoribosylamino)uracil reductase
MSRCIELAQNGLPYALPNPLVGCVIVHDNIIIGEGYHKQFGGDHAEVVAINSVKNKDLLVKSTLYVSLEPCSHFGKTPPCADLILEHKIPRVVCAMKDPNPSVSGMGLSRLKEAGVDVTTGIMEKEAQEINKAFICYHSKGRPYIILKWAKTIDGYMGRDGSKSGLSKQISGEVANTWVHKLRSESQAIVVGNKTVSSDNPRLTTRLHPGPDPMRVVLDTHGRIPSNSNVLIDGLPTTIFGKRKSPGYFDTISVAENEDMLKELIDWSVRNNFVQILVEGGSDTLQRFFKADLWDEAFEIGGQPNWGKGIFAPEMKRSPDNSFRLGKDIVRHYISNHR